MYALYHNKTRVGFRPTGKRVVVSLGGITVSLQIEKARSLWRSLRKQGFQVAK